MSNNNIMPGIDIASIYTRQALQLANMAAESPETIAKLVDDHRLEILLAYTELRTPDDVAELMTLGKLVEFKGFFCNIYATQIYRLKGQKIEDGFYVMTGGAHGPHAYRYPEAFKVTQVLPLRREDPATPTLDDLGPWGVHSNMWPICKVMATRDDAVRIVFADPGSHIIRAIVEAYNNESQFNQVDVGNFIRTQTKYVAVLGRKESKEKMHIPETYALLKKTPIRGANGYPDSNDAYARIRQEYVDKFIRGRHKEIQVKCFKFTRSSFSYSDTVLKTSRPCIKAVLKIVLDSPYTSFDTLFDEIMRGAGSYGFNINGTPIKVEQRESKNKAAALWYVNGRKISIPDLTEVMRHVLCFPNAPEIYNDYLDTVSKMSLKFHQAVSKGLTMLMRATWLNVAVKTADGNELRRPGGMKHSDSAWLELKVRINKTFGVRSSFNFLGQTRIITNFDSFKRVLEEGLLSRNVEHPRQIQDGTPHKALLQRLLALDYDLEPESRFLKDFEESLGYIAASESNSDRAVLLYSQCSEAFSTGLNHEAEVLKRSHDLLLQTMEETHAVCEQVDDKWVYKITGASGTRYVIDEETASVHADTDGKAHICIVKANGDIDGYDYISSLLMALAQDKMTARKIHTLEKYVEKEEA